MNRGRHKKIYPKEIYKLRNIKAFTNVFTPENAKALLYNIKEQNPDGKIDILAWEKSPNNTTAGQGFRWYESKEGHFYWQALISKYIQYTRPKYEITNEGIKISNQK